MDTVAPPRVFISHASEDKERFVLNFANRLRSSGVEAWLDLWEMLPGDSLVDKIFHDGIRNAEIVVIVLSQYSVNKPWVREEINASFMRRIAGSVKIIPVIIDDCEIPEVLLSTVHERIANLDEYDAAFQRIISAIFNISQKPSLGVPPRHTQLQIDHLPGLSAVDTQVFKVACEAAIESGQKSVPTDVFDSRLKELDITREDALESLELLENRFLIDASWVMGDHTPFFSITNRGFENYGKFYIPDFDDLIVRTLLAILNYNLTTAGQIADHLNQRPIIVEFILDILNDRKHIKVIKYLGDSRESIVVNEVTVQGKRFAARVAR